MKTSKEKKEEINKYIGELKMKGEKINKTLIAERLGVSRGMVIRHCKEMEMGEKKERKRRRCGILKYDEMIKEMFKDPQNSIKAVYKYLTNISTLEDIGTYSNFKQYVERHYSNIRKEARKANSRYRYETPIGEQLQFDWIEEVKMHLKDSTEVRFNIWSATLGWSRFHFYRCTLGKTEADFRRCLIDTLIAIGGKPKEVLTDNMSAIVKIENNKRYIHPTVTQFMKDIDVKLRLCQVRHCFTKGKVEVSNKYQNWLHPYDYKFETVDDLMIGVEQILKQVNYEKNDTTGMAPIVLFHKEKEHLKKLPSLTLLKQYHSQLITKDVNISNLVKYNGAFYGVPNKYCNKKVLLCEQNNQVQIYSESMELLQIYKVYTSGIHYGKGLYNVAKMKNETEEEYAQRISKNLELLEQVGGGTNAHTVQ